MAQTIIGKLDHSGIVKTVESRSNDYNQLSDILVNYYDDEGKIDNLLQNKNVHKLIEVLYGQESFINVGELIKIRPHIQKFYVWVYGKWLCFDRYGDPINLDEI